MLVMVIVPLLFIVTLFLSVLLREAVVRVLVRKIDAVDEAADIVQSSLNRPDI